MFLLIFLLGGMWRGQWNKTISWWRTGINNTNNIDIDIDVSVVEGCGRGSGTPQSAGARARAVAGCQNMVKLFCDL